MESGMETCSTTRSRRSGDPLVEPMPDEALRGPPTTKWSKILSPTIDLATWVWQLFLTHLEEVPDMRAKAYTSVTPSRVKP